MKNKTILGIFLLGFLMLVVGSISASTTSTVIDAADRIVDLQHTNGSWDWEVTGNTTYDDKTYLNIAGVTAEVLLDAYKLTLDSKYLDAAKKTGDYLVDEIGSLPDEQLFNAFNIVFLQHLSELSGDSTYSDFAEEKMDDLIDEVAYWKDSSNNIHSICGGDGCTAEELIEDDESIIRSWSTEPSGIVVWDMYNYIEAAQIAEKNSFANDMADEIDDYMDQSEFNDTIDYYVLGLSGGIIGLANAGESYNSYLNDLLDEQESDGSFSDEPIQGTAYALMALQKAGETSAAEDAADYLESEFGYGSIDGWKESDGKEYSEVTSEAAQALYGELCVVIVDEPEEGEWYDPITIAWHYEGKCDPIEYNLFYQEETCDGDNWSDPIVEVGAGTTEYEWDITEMLDGPYCIAVNMDQELGPDVTGHSGVWYLDLTPPEADYNIFDGPSHECEEGEDCDYYITQDTRIQITCQDQGEWQSGPPYTKYYRYRVDNGSWNGWYEYEGPFDFDEDTTHELEYYCTDSVGKESPVEDAVLIVDTVAPEIEKIIEGNAIGTCPPGSLEDTCHISTSTHIIATGTDPDPHPVGGVECRYWYFVDDQCLGEECEPGILCEGDVCDITFPEDTQHRLYITCWDALGNDYTDVETFLVDGSSPETTLSFEGPYYSDCESQWIDTESRVVLEAIDNPQESICAVDNVTTYYRYETVEDWKCETLDVQVEPTDKEDESWMVYEEPFGLPESCQMIEYYSEDALGNSENIKREFVFSDHTAPEPIKEVGKPSHDCNGFWETITGKCEEDWDWIVTMQTPITISCNDVGPHPSGVDEICYKISWDDEVTEDWECISYEQVPEGLDIYFYEECEHTLEFYCVDNVNKTSEIDTEVFKVKGTSKEIDLNKKWNLISVPFNLLSNNIKEVFNDTSEYIEEIWSYENGEWLVYYPDNEEDSTLEIIIPGRGYWVKTTDDTSLLVGGELLSEGPILPPSVELDKGWNLIGHYGLIPKKSYCSLFSLVDTQEGHPRWSALYGYNSDIDWFIPLNTWDLTFPGRGYWIEMDVEDSYSPATACWGGP